MPSFFTTFFARLKAETPPFFKKIRGMGQILMTSGTAAIASKIVPGVDTPAELIALGKEAIVTGFVMTLIASLAVNDPTTLPK